MTDCTQHVFNKLKNNGKSLLSPQKSWMLLEIKTRYLIWVNEENKRPFNYDGVLEKHMIS
jgi:hypothetical protein